MNSSANIENNKVRMCYHVEQTKEEISVNIEASNKEFENLFIELINRFNGEIPKGKVICRFAL